MQPLLQTFQIQDAIIRTITANYTVDAVNDGVILVDGIAVVTLPDVAAASNKSFFVKNIGDGSVTIQGTGGQLIDDGIDFTLTTKYNSLQMISDGTQWWII